MGRARCIVDGIGSCSVGINLRTRGSVATFDTLALVVGRRIGLVNVVDMIFFRRFPLLRPLRITRHLRRVRLTVEHNVLHVPFGCSWPLALLAARLTLAAPHALGIA
jgi:hypothetical protein